MDWNAWFALGVVAVIFVGLARDYAPDMLLLSGVILFAVAGLITPQEAFSGFSNEGMLTVAALFIVASAMRETGALDT
ncbi:MAG: SLC13 family permease, partial [Candidatus Hydrogenedentes bacterium]|nr:SLC13 family permease [Candidatus Hydrogenedentota bacterium]